MKFAETKLREIIEDRRRIALAGDLEPRAHTISSAGIDACIATILHIAEHW